MVIRRIDHMLKDRAKIERAVEAMVDGQLARNALFAVALNEPCRIETRASGAERERSGAERLQYDRRAWFRAAANLQDGDLVTISGTQYEAVRVATSTGAPHKAALLKIR